MLKSALTSISIFLLASVVLANHPPKHPRSQPLQRSVIYNQGIAGAAFEGSSVDYVTAVFTIPHITGRSGTSATVLAVLDGFNDCHDLFSAGVQMLIDDDGPFYQAVYQDESGGIYRSFGPRLFAGDYVQVTVGANQDRKTGYALLTYPNRQTNQRWTANLSSSSSHCLRFGGWIIEKVGDTLPNFGTVTLQGAANGLGTSYTPPGSAIFDIKGQISTSISGNDVVIKRV